MMKCRKAQDLYFLSRDGALDEAGRMELARHLAHCSACGLLVKEMEASLDAAGSLPELSVSDGFEWNVKRRIMQEKSKLMRRDVKASPFGEKKWASRFALGAVAAAAVVIVAATFVAQRIGMNEPKIREASRENRTGTAPIPAPFAEQDVLSDYRMAGSYVGPRMVSDNIFTIERGGESVRQSPFEVVGSREDSLAQQNELLKRRIQRLERQLMIYKGMLDKERMQRLNSSLP
jgi:hypothetical protein